MANSTVNNRSTVNGIDFDPVTLEAIRTAAPTSETVKLPATVADRATALPETKHCPADDYDSRQDPMPLRIKSKGKNLWRAMKTRLSRTWKKASGKTRE